MKPSQRLWAILVLGLLMSQFSACIVVDNTFTGLPPGPWRGVLKLEPSLVTPNPKGQPLPEKMGMDFEEVTNGELPFNFEVIYENETDFRIEFINGEERIVIKDIIIGLDRATAKDTIRIDFPVYDAYLTALYEEGIMEGDWVVNNRGEPYRIPFAAYHGQDHRFTSLRKPPAADLTGRWSATFGVGGEAKDSFPAIAEFKQDGNYLTGTFLTETGDYRFLQGSVQADKVYLSCFDGAHAFLFEARIGADGGLLGSFRSGKHYQVLWTAQRDEEASLRDPHELTFLKPGYESFDFSFPKPNGQLVSLSDEAYQDKVVLVQIMGTWCPNCRDETEFLKRFLKEREGQDIAAVGLAFERYREQDQAMAAIRRFNQGVQPGYELLLAGYADKDEAAKALPMLNQVLAYPTLIVIGKDKQVKRIHTGFSGPATSEYADFEKKFNTFITQLLEEQQ